MANATEPLAPFVAPTPADLALAASIVDSHPVVSAYAAVEWDELDENGQIWIAAIVSEARDRSADAPRLINRKIDEECGCPEEIWDAYGAHLFMHLRAGGQSDAHADYGDQGEVEMTVNVATYDLARAAIFAWARALAHPMPPIILDSTKTGGQG